MAGIRDANENDFEAVFELLDARSRAAFGISQQQREHLRQRWDLPATGKWVAVEDRVLVGYASLEEDQTFVHVAADPRVGDTLLAHIEHQARARGYPHVDVTAVPEDVPLYDAVQRNGYTLDR